MKPGELAEKGLARKAEIIFKAALAEVDPERLIRENVRRQGARLIIQGKSFDLDRYENIFLAAFGKAAPWMAKGLSSILGSRLTKGVAVCLPGQALAIPGVRCLVGSHPLPDKRSLRAAQAILGLAREASPRDLIFVLISGGGSSLVCLPLPPVTLREKRWITGALMRAGASIVELNTVRKHLSAVKGGRLAEAAYPAAVVNLVISDVIGNDLEAIASGPTSWDSSTYEQAVQVLKKYSLWQKAPASIKKVLLAGLKGKKPETIKRGDRIFRKVSSFVIGDNLIALKGAARKAEDLGFEAFILSSTDSGEARTAAQDYAALLAGLARSKKVFRKPLCLLAGGELTVTVRGKGKGGRNTEFALALLVEGMKTPSLFFPQEKKRPPLTYLAASLGTDGRDGPTDAAGAWVGASTLARAGKLGLDPADYLSRNDSYSFFKKAGGLIITGPTRTNVMDVRLFLLQKSKG